MSRRSVGEINYKDSSRLGIVNRQWLRSRRNPLATIAVVITLTGLFTAAYALHLFGGQTTDCWRRPASTPNTAIFTVVMANEGVNVGFNGSKYEAVPWPVMNVTLGQNVIIHVINNDSVEPHGFQVIHYFDQGINGLSGLAPGQCYDVRFTANVLGSFTVQCNIFCTIHQVMLKGQLNVEP